MSSNEFLLVYTLIRVHCLRNSSNIHDIADSWMEHQKLHTIRSHTKHISRVEFNASHFFERSVIYTASDIVRLVQWQFDDTLRYSKLLNSTAHREL